MKKTIKNTIKSKKRKSTKIKLILKYKFFQLQFFFFKSWRFAFRQQDRGYLSLKNEDKPKSSKIAKLKMQ